MKILIIDNNIDQDSWGSEPIVRYARKAPDAMITVRRAPQGDLPRDPSAFDCVVVSGSKTSAIDPAPWVGALDEFIRQTIRSKVPYLGICFGHQSLVRALAGEKFLSNGTAPEYGWTEIQVTAPSAIFKGLPQKFYSFSTHSDEVTGLPAEFKKTAQSAQCGIQACELTGTIAYGVQFHPEKNLAEGNASVLKSSKQKPKDVVFNPHRGAELYDEKVGELIFGNFWALAGKGASG